MIATDAGRGAAAKSAARDGFDRAPAGRGPDAGALTQYVSGFIEDWGRYVPICPKKLSASLGMTGPA
jgi:hypothetical protein